VGKKDSNRTLIFLLFLSFTCIVLFTHCRTSNEEEEALVFSFSETMTEEVLNNYLSRAVSHQILFTDQDTNLLEDDIRMFLNIGAKFIGRASIIWDTPEDLEQFFSQAEMIASQVHKEDPEILLQAGLFEIVDSAINQIEIPAWVFLDLGFPVEERAYSYEDMLYSDPEYINFYGQGKSVPDISKKETQLWYYHRAKLYIDSGYEAIHFGIADLISMNDPDHYYLLDLFTRIRVYASVNARRDLILLDAHHTTGWVVDGKTLFDFLSYPLRIQEIPQEPFKAVLCGDLEDSIYNKTLGGLTPNGWTAVSLPYLVEFDNWGSSGKGGESIGGFWVWGWDEICWFSSLSENERNDWLFYAYYWIKENTDNGYLQFPTRRILADPIDNKYFWYSANKPSLACENGFNEEEQIKSLWETATDSR